MPFYKSKGYVVNLERYIVMTLFALSMASVMSYMFDTVPTPTSSVKPKRSTQVPHTRISIP
jgi:hypothetical protein